MDGQVVEGQEGSAADGPRAQGEPPHGHAPAAAGPETASADETASVDTAVASSPVAGSSSPAASGDDCVEAEVTLEDARAPVSSSLADGRSTDEGPAPRRAETPREDAKGKDEPQRRLFGVSVTPGRAAAGLAAAAAGAYAVYLLGAGRSRRKPVTELPNALGMRIEYVPWGDVHYAYYTREGHGRPLVLLHSINAVASAHEMRPLARAFLRERDRPVHALEWIGFGHSDRPEIEYTPGVMEDQLEHWLERIIRPAGGADVVGLSLGASYAAEVARRRPDLIRSLVALEPAGLGGEPTEIGRGWARLLFTLPGVQRAFYDRLTTPEALQKFARDNLFTPEFGVPDEYVGFGAETARVEGAPRPLDDFLSGRMFPDDAVETYRRLRQPVLIIHGTVESRRMESFTHLPELAGRPNVQIVGLPTGAMPHWERAREVAGRIADFFEGEGRRRAE